MRTPDRDRCGPALAYISAALVIALVAAPCAALHAEYRVLPDGTAYNASVDVADADRFDFFDIGALGERIPQEAGDIQLTGNCSPCLYNESGISSIAFARGNYTIVYTAPLRDYHLQVPFEHPYSVRVSLPEGFDAKNPLLAGISPGGVIIEGGDNTTMVQWNRTLSVDLRFYDKEREGLLFVFGNFWVVICLVLLLPYLITLKRNE